MSYNKDLHDAYEHYLDWKNNHTQVPLKSVRIRINDTNITRKQTAEVKLLLDVKKVVGANNADIGKVVGVSPRVVSSIATKEVKKFIDVPRLRFNSKSGREALKKLVMVINGKLKGEVL